MDETEITAVVCKPGDDARVVPIPNTVDAFIDAVGGLFEVLFLSNPGVWAYVHEEGVLLGLPWNRILRNQPIAGNILVTGITSSGDDDQSLTIVERERVLQLLNGRAARLRPTPSSIEEWEAMTGRPIFWPHRAGEPTDTAMAAWMRRMAVARREDLRRFAGSSTASPQPSEDGKPGK